MSEEGSLIPPDDGRRKYELSPATASYIDGSTGFKFADIQALEDTLARGIALPKDMSAADRAVRARDYMQTLHQFYALQDMAAWAAKQPALVSNPDADNILQDSGLNYQSAQDINFNNTYSE